MKFKELLEKTEFIKNYSNKKPKVELIINAIEAANMGPSAGNLQPIQYVIVEDPEGIAAIAEACQQSFIAKAPYVIIITSDLTQMERLYDGHGSKYLKQNVGAAIQNLTLQLAESKISTSLVAPFSDATLKNHFGIPDGKEIEMIIPAGEGIGGPVRKKKPSLVNKIFYDSFGNKTHGSRPSQVSRKDI